MFIDTSDPRAEAAIASIREGDVDALTSHLAAYPELVTARIGTASEARTLLHILTDWPGHFPNGPAVARALIAAGADINARFVGPLHAETPLHWTASCDDVAVMEVLLDAGADIEADGGVIAETPLADARAFLQLKAARMLIDRGALVTLQDAATLGLQDRVEAFYRADSADPPRPLPSQEDTNLALWNACHGGQLATAQFLHGRGADLGIVPPWEKLTPLDVARRNNAADVVQWLEKAGAPAIAKVD